MTSPRLNPALLETLNPQLTPRYDRDHTKVGIVHLGIGAFHRAHQAYYTEAVLNATGGDWRILGCSLRSAAVARQLQPQDCLYTLMEKGAANRFQVIGAVKDVLVGPESPHAIVEAIAADTTKVVTLTVTEKGYCHDPATGDLNFAHPDILHDLASPVSPKTAVGMVVAGLRTRRQQKRPGLTVLSCDNLPDNGKVTQRVVTQFAQKVAPDLAAWIAENVTFPSSMVDRIVPATSADDLLALEALAGYHDEAMVVAEPFTQWVVEDNFCQGRPAWEDAGALLVDDVTAYEHMKLRLLNGSHSLLAYTGYLAGFETMSQVMQDPNFVELCARFMQTAAKTLKPPAGFDIEAYQHDLRLRFANPGLKHRTWQIAMDGSQKVPQRWLATLRDLLTQGDNYDIIALGLAAWMRFVTGVNEQGQAIEVSDPFGKDFKALAEAHPNDIPQYVQAFFAQEKIFGVDLGKHHGLVQTTTDYLQRIYTDGIKAVVAEA